MFSVFAWPGINTRGVGIIRDSYANPRPTTVENSPNPSRVYIRLCKYRKKTFSIAFIKLTFSRNNAKLFVMVLIKRETLTSREVLFCKNTFQITDFSYLKCQLKLKKKRHGMFVKIFQVSADKEIGK